MIQKPDGTQCYTRNGHFNLSKNTSGGWSLTTQEGYAVLDSTGKEISFDADVDTSKLRFDNYGGIGYVGDDGNALGIFWQGLFMFWGKKPLLEELFLELLEGDVQVTHALDTEF